MTIRYRRAIAAGVGRGGLLPFRPGAVFYSGQPPPSKKTDVNRWLACKAAAMRFLSVQQAVSGKQVLFAGEDQDAGGIVSAELRARDHVLMPHHPGLINSFVGPGLNHCLVDFFGLEEEPISFAVGFDHDEEGFYWGLIDPTADEWQVATSAGWWTDQHRA